MQPKSRDSFDAILRLYDEQGDVYDFWTEPRFYGLPVDVMVPPERTGEFLQLMESHNIRQRVKIADVQR